MQRIAHTKFKVREEKEVFTAKKKSEFYLHSGNVKTRPPDIVEFVKRVHDGERVNPGTKLSGRQLKRRRSPSPQRPSR